MINNTNPELLATPPVTNPLDVEVDVEVLRSVPPKFCIATSDNANWLVRKICASRQYTLTVKENFERELRRAEREETTLMFLFGRQLQEWTRAEVAKFGGRRKSLILPAGVVGFRHEGARLVVDDETLVLKWAQKNLPEAVVVVTRLSRSVLNADFRGALRTDIFAS